MADNCFEIATDKSGCCVLQQCIKYAQGELKERLVADIITNAMLLAEDRYGFVPTQLRACFTFNINSNMY